MEVLRLVRIVLSAFFGVRKRASHEADFANANIVALPFVAVFLAGCIGGCIFGVVHLFAHSVSAMQGFCSARGHGSRSTREFKTDGNSAFAMFAPHRPTKA